MARERKAKRARPAGLFRWRRRLGLFDNAAQVAEELHVRYKLPVNDAWAIVGAVQREHGDPMARTSDAAMDPRQLWGECRRRAAAGHSRVLPKSPLAGCRRRRTRSSHDPADVVPPPPER